VARLDLGREWLAAGDAAAARPHLLRVVEEDAADPERPAVTAAMVLAAAAQHRLGETDAARRQLEAAHQAALERGVTDLLADIEEAWQQIVGEPRSESTPTGPPRAVPVEGSVEHGP
jgi:hypothetical protein